MAWGAVFLLLRGFENYVKKLPNQDVDTASEHRQTIEEFIDYLQRRYRRKKWFRFLHQEDKASKFIASDSTLTPEDREMRKGMVDTFRMYIYNDGLLLWWIAGLQTFLLNPVVIFFSAFCAIIIFLGALNEGIEAINKFFSVLTVIPSPPTLTFTPTLTLTSAFMPTQTPISTFTPIQTSSPTLTFTTATSISTVRPGATTTPPTVILQACASNPQTISINRNAEWTPCTRMFNDVPMVLVPAGSFMRGSTQVEIDTAMGDCIRRVDSGYCPVPEWYRLEGYELANISKPFWIDRFEVTNAEYKKCVEAEDEAETEPCTPPQNTTYFDDENYDQHPVVYVTWIQATQYANWRDCRLPFQNEWEYAARGPDRLIYTWEGEFDGTKLNYCDASCKNNPNYPRFNDGYSWTSPVGSFSSGASWVGAMDMLGNVWEWVANQGDDAAGESNNRIRHLRGTSFLDAGDIRAARGTTPYSDTTDSTRGFRCARNF